MHVGQIGWRVANGEEPRDNPAIEHLTTGRTGGPEQGRNG